MCVAVAVCWTNRVKASNVCAGVTGLGWDQGGGGCYKRGWLCAASTRQASSPAMPRAVWHRHRPSNTLCAVGAVVCLCLPAVAAWSTGGGMLRSTVCVLPLRSTPLGPLLPCLVLTLCETPAVLPAAPPLSRPPHPPSCRVVCPVVAAGQLHCHDAQEGSRVVGWAPVCAPAALQPRRREAHRVLPC